MLFHFASALGLAFTIEVIFFYASIALLIVLTAVMLNWFAGRNKRNESNDTQKHIKIPNFLAGIVIDGAAVCAIVYILIELGLIQTQGWSNRLTGPMVGTLSFALIRLFSRSFYRVSPGEKLVKASRFSTRNLIFISIVELTVAIFAPIRFIH